MRTASSPDVEEPGGLTWAIIRQDGNGSRYRVSRYATRQEAERVCEAFQARGYGPLYVIEKVDRQQAP
ncbi:SPOR domain-containing protein [Streptomyces sp. RPT161]|uniref:SPOR domain-containing protein n=1 Tax=Streptomyces sp. RPT161 TaxID=3015993 RepID=UPI0022B8D33D|nr:SPOR domain-containing protein [Streptomyces sp. RPT161]